MVTSMTWSVARMNNINAIKGASALAVVDQTVHQLQLKSSDASSDRVMIITLVSVHYNLIPGHC